MSHVLLKNRKTGGVWLCPEDAVEGWKSLGWADAAKSDTPTDEAPAVASTTKEK